MKKGTILISAIILGLAGCAGSQVTQTSKNTMLIDVGAAPACGQVGAAKVASKTAAVETIKAGFDGYIIGGAAAQNNVSTVTSLGPSQTYGTYGSGRLNTTTYYTTNTTQIGSHDRQLHVVMFKKTDPGYSQSINARNALGENWEETVKNGVHNCL